MSIYARLQGTASRLFSRFAQGDVRYVGPVEQGGDPWNPEPSLNGWLLHNGTWDDDGEWIDAAEWNDGPLPVGTYQLAATVSGVSRELVDGPSILATDLEVRFAEFGSTVDPAGRIQVDGRDLEIVQVTPIPASGTVVAWRVVVRA